jgi:hypothetical protein
MCKSFTDKRCLAIGQAGEGAADSLDGKHQGRDERQAAGYRRFVQSANAAHAELNAQEHAKRNRERLWLDIQVAGFSTRAAG